LPGEGIDMFFYIGMAFFLLGCIPLFLTLRRAGAYDRRALQRRLVVSISVVVVDIACIVAFNLFMGIYTELLWFRVVEYAQRYWTALGARVALFLAGAVVGFLFVLANVRLMVKRNFGSPGPGRGLVLSGIAALVLGSSLTGSWETALLYVNRVSGPLTDPIFDKSIGFYLFALPFYGILVPWGIFAVIVAALVSVAGVVVEMARSQKNLDMLQQQLPGRIRPGGQLWVLTGLVLLILGFNAWLGLFRLMYSTEGVVTGAGYVDVHFRTLGQYVSMAVFGIAGVLAVAAGASSGIRRTVFGIRLDHASGTQGPSPRTAILPLIAITAIVLFTRVIPAVVMQLKVEPNEITLEQPYITHNIHFTRQGYGIDSSRIQSREYTVDREVTRDMVDANPMTIRNIRLWDPRALMDNLREQQEIRLYYEFHDVDIDRYHLDGEYREVMLSTRELAKEELAPQSQTWVSRHVKYTHGYGLVLLPVHEFLPQGKPNLLVKNIPPREKVKSLEITRPQIYYGERTNDHVYVNTTEKEFDYPSGDQNVYSTYEGSGGVEIGSLLPRIAYAWKFGDYRLFFSGYFTPESRTLMYRNIVERASRLAPFLLYDRDPYAVLTPEGRIKYLIDAYTVSPNYPYSERYGGDLRHFHGNNYFRNSVKVVVDAYDGTVDFYMIDTSDVMIRTYDRVFPGLFQPVDSMPEAIMDHIRYPVDFLTVQAEMYSTYHMEEPDVFYQREDVWQFATERYRESFQQVAPYYVMIHFPETERVEFSLITTFTPKNKNVINAWMAGRCDMPNYGKLMVFTFPKGVEVLGPRQIEARIDQNTEMSQAMTLWGQRGSEVIRGNLLAIPLFYREGISILYAEPIYLQAEDAQLPEIKRIALADQQRVVWAESFDGSLRKLLGEASEEAVDTTEMIRTVQPAPAMRKTEPAARGAARLLAEYRELSARGQFSEAGRKLETLDSLLGSPSSEIE